MKSRCVTNGSNCWKQRSNIDLWYDLWEWKKREIKITDYCLHACCAFSCSVIWTCRGKCIAKFLFASLPFGHRSFKAELWPFFESIRNHEISMHVILVSYLFSKPKLTFHPIARCHFCVSQQRKLHTSCWTASVRRWRVSLTFLPLLDKLALGNAVVLGRPIRLMGRTQSSQHFTDWAWSSITTQDFNEPELWVCCNWCSFLIGSTTLHPRFVRPFVFFR